MTTIRCEHCGDYPVQKCADCKAQFDISTGPWSLEADGKCLEDNRIDCPRDEFCCKAPEPKPSWIDKINAAALCIPCKENLTAKALVLYSGDCSVCRGLRPADCPGCGGDNERLTIIRPVSIGYTQTGSYLEGREARVREQAFISNPKPRGSDERNEWFNGWLDANDSLVPIGHRTPFDGVPADLRLTELLRR